jgi:hypothetical protein
MLASETTEIYAKMALIELAKEFRERGTVELSIPEKRTVKLG